MCEYNEDDNIDSMTQHSSKTRLKPQLASEPPLRLEAMELAKEVEVLVRAGERVPLVLAERLAKVTKYQFVWVSEALKLLQK